MCGTYLELHPCFVDVVKDLCDLVLPVLMVRNLPGERTVLELA